MTKTLSETYYISYFYEALLLQAMSQTESDTYLFDIKCILIYPHLSSNNNIVFLVLG